VQIALRAKRFESLLRGLRGPPCFLRAENLPALRTVHVSPIVGGNGGFKRLPWELVCCEATDRTWARGGEIEIGTAARIWWPLMPLPSTKAETIKVDGLSRSR